MQPLKAALSKSTRSRPAGRERGKGHLKEKVATCPVCDGAGVVVYDAPIGHALFGKTTDCPSPGCQAALGRHLRRVNRMYRWAQLGERYRTFKLGHFGHYPEVVDIAWELIEYGSIQAGDWNHYGLFLWGDVGVGKTALAAAIANELIGRTAVMCLSAAALLDELRATYHPESEHTLSAMLHEAMDVPWLILDDLGAHQTTSWAIEKLLTLINSRDANQRPMIITSNWSPETLLKEFTKADDWQARRMMSRIISLTHVVQLSGPDLRLGSA